jgi:hypothetical protein
MPEQQPLLQREQDKGADLDYRKRRAEQATINIDGAVVEWFESF